MQVIKAILPLITSSKNLNKIDSLPFILIVIATIIIVSTTYLFNKKPVMLL